MIGSPQLALRQVELLLGIHFCVLFQVAQGKESFMINLAISKLTRQPELRSTMKPSWCQGFRSGVTRHRFCVASQVNESHPSLVMGVRIVNISLCRLAQGCQPILKLARLTKPFALFSQDLARMERHAVTNESELHFPMVQLGCFLQLELFFTDLDNNPVQRLPAPGQLCFSTVLCCLVVTAFPFECLCVQFCEICRLLPLAEIAVDFVETLCVCEYPFRVSRMFAEL